MTSRTGVVTTVAPALILVFAMLVALPAAAADAIFLQVSGIGGSSQVPGHEGWIEALGLSHGAAKPPGGGGPPGPPEFTDITVLKVTDATSPLLNFMSANGDPIAEVLIDVCRFQDQMLLCPYQLTLRQAWITGIRLAASSCVDPTACGGLPTENVTFTFNEIVWKYTPYDDQGNAGPSTTTTYNRTTGEKG